MYSLEKHDHCVVLAILLLLLYTTFMLKDHGHNLSAYLREYVPPHQEVLAEKGTFLTYC